MARNVKKLPSDIEITIKLMKRYLDDKKTSNENKDRIRDIINMYKARSIKSFATASKIIKALSNRSKLSREKGIKLYNQIAKEIIKIRVILYRKQRDHELENPVRKKKYLNKLLPDYTAYWIGYLNVLARREDIIEYYNKVQRKPAPDAPDSELDSWSKLMSILKTNKDVERYIYQNDSGDGIDAVLIVSYQALRNAPAIHPRNNLQRSIEKTFINFSYRIEQLNMTAKNLKEAIDNGDYKKYRKDNECWINALYEKYGDNLLNPNKNVVLLPVKLSIKL